MSEKFGGGLARGFHKKVRLNYLRVREKFVRAKR
jgi:hypothetical protein